MCQYDGKIKKMKQKLTPPALRLVSDETVTYRLGTLSWIVSQLDCKWKLDFFSLLDPEICKQIGRIGENLFSGP